MTFSRQTKQLEMPCYVLCAITFVILSIVVSSGFASNRQVVTQTQTTTSQDDTGKITLSLLTPSVPVAAGQPFNVIVTAIAPPNTRLLFPELGEQVGAFNLLEIERQPDIPTDNGRQFRWKLLLDSLEPGQQELPAFAIEIRTVEGEEDGSVSTSPVTLTVNTSLSTIPEEAELQDIRGPIDISLSKPWPWWAWLIIGCSVTIAIIAFLLILANRRTEEAALPVAQLLPADIEAMAAIDKLESEQLLNSARFHIFYTRLSTIVRRYIERRFSVMAPERTTDEFLREIRHQAILSGAQKDALESFLRAADMVKFAKHEPLPQEGNAALLGARQFVEQTRPHELDESDQIQEVA